VYWGKDFPVKEIGIHQIKEFMMKRLEDNAKPSEVNRERGALSKLFKILMEAEIVDRNPVKGTSPLDEREGQRDTCISCKDFIRIVEEYPLWAQPVFETLYLTGMRRGEVLGLTWDMVDLQRRIITLGWSQTKEQRPKRVPIHKTLVSILADVRKECPFKSDIVFLNDEGDPPHEDSLTRVWRTAVQALNIDPRPTPHDFRHTWKTNAMRSGIFPAIADMILGHGNRKKDLQSLYISVSNADLLDAIDRMKFDKGETEIWVTERGNGKLRR
jgi:integrase